MCLCTLNPFLKINHTRRSDKIGQHWVLRMISLFNPPIPHPPPPPLKSMPKLFRGQNLSEHPELECGKSLLTSQHPKILFNRKKAHTQKKNHACMCMIKSEMIFAYKCLFVLPIRPILWTHSQKFLRNKKFCKTNFHLWI